MQKRLRFLCVHQGFELYGSDRMFIHSIATIRQNYPDSDITVHLPEKGPLLGEIGKYTNDIIIGNMMVLRRASLSFRSLLRLPAVLKETLHRIRTYDVVYINTLTVLSYILVSRFAGKPCILHVHEIVSGFEKIVFKMLIQWSKCFVIYNSQATQQVFHTGNASVCIYNGITINPNIPDKKTHNPLKLLMIGRLNAWKGQDLVVEAVYILHKNLIRDIQLRIVGSAFAENSQYTHALQTAINAYGMQDRIELLPFTSEPAQHYMWADIVLVPSKKPEPFGLVALEGMNYGCPVIAAEHGGLTEIVVHKNTGLLFRPNNADDLAECIRTYYVHRNMVEKHGLNGYNRLKEKFNIHFYEQQFSKVIADHVV